MSSIIEQLRSAGLRNTRDRRRILKHLQEHRTWTAAQLQAVLPQTDLSTIYRTLQTFVEVGLVVMAHSHDAEQHFERAQQAHHDHQICDQCDVVQCVPCPIPDQSTHHLELFGTCGSCA